jgi:hypothetical protein
MASINEAYELSTQSKYKNKYAIEETKQSKLESDYRVTNHRTTEYTKNPNYMFKKDELYDLQGIDDGKGPGKNILVDDKLTRGNWEPRPDDKLNEKVTFIRYVDFLPEKDKNIDHDQFLVSTSLPKKPQTQFCPQFDKYGINTRNYQRKQDLYFKDKYQRY